MKYLALLRGINVGGNNIIKMTALKSCFEENGFKNVVTYIQSGNVIFESDQKDLATLTTQIEKVLSKKFNYASRVVVVSQMQLKGVVKNAPQKFGKNPAEYRYDVIFLKTPLAAKEAMKSISVKDGVDEVSLGKGALYFSRLISKAAQSKMVKIITMPIYQNLTIRNWNTTTKLLVLMEGKN